jgi:hypothetical protein
VEWVGKDFLQIENFSVDVMGCDGQYQDIEQRHTPTQTGETEMTITTAEFSAMYDAFVAVSNRIHGKSLTKKYLQAVQRVFSYSAVIEFRKNHCVIVETDDGQKMFAYSHSSNRFYHLDKWQPDTAPVRNWRDFLVSN